MPQKPKIKFRLTKPKTAVLIAVAVMLVLCTVTLVTVNIAIANTRAETDALRGEAYAEEQLGDRLQRYMQELGTIQGIIRVAQEELGLIEPGAIIFDTETGN